MTPALPDLPRVRLLDGATPLLPLERLSSALGRRTELWIKREDLAGPGFGGNKIRQIRLILAEAKAAGADTVITTAASQSNFCRALAGCAAREGLACHLLLRRAGGMEMQGNLLLDHIFGAQVSWTDLTDPWDPAIEGELEAIAAAVHRQIVDFPGVARERKRHWLRFRAIRHAAEGNIEAIQNRFELHG